MVFSPVFLVMNIIVCVVMGALFFRVRTNENKILFAIVAVWFGGLAVLQTLAAFEII